MLPLKNRLKKKKEFDKVFKEGVAQKGQFVLLKSVDNDLNYPRFGIVVSKKVSNRAVDRNKIKRRLREAVRAFLPEKGRDYVIVSFPQIMRADYKEIEEQIRELL